MMSEISSDLSSKPKRTRRTSRRKGHKQKKATKTKKSNSQKRKRAKRKKRKKGARIKKEKIRNTKSKELSLEKLINMSHNLRQSKKIQKRDVSNVLSSDTIKQQLINNKFDNDKKYFIMLHVSWCPHCTNALPSFMRAKKILNKDKNIIVEEFECEKHPELKNVASGFPTFLEIVKNNVTKYSGPREVDDFVDRCRSL